MAVVELIGATTTKDRSQGRVRARRADLPEGHRIKKAEMKPLDITGDAFHPEWNYTIKPRIAQRTVAVIAASVLGLEDASVHRPIDDKRHRQPMTSQPGDEGLGLPVSKRSLAYERYLCAAATQARHLGAGAGLVNEDEPVSFEPHLRLTLGEPFIARLPDVGSILLAGQQSFF